jgi:transposase
MLHGGAFAQGTMRALFAHPSLIVGELPPKFRFPAVGVKRPANMERGNEMKKLRKPSFTTEFRGLSVQRVKAGNSFAVVAKELAINQQSLRNWVKAFDAGKLGGPGTRMVTPEPDGGFAAADREHPLAAAV